MSKLNRDSWAQIIDRSTKNPNYSADTLAELRSILGIYDEALARGDPTFELHGSGKAPAPGPNPMRGRLVLLTDYDCFSACLDFMDEAMAMPNVVQAGTVASADTIFMELTRVPELPSGISTFSFPHKAWIKRARGSNILYTPSPRFTWTGALSDNEGLRAWLEEALASP